MIALLPFLRLPWRRKRPARRPVVTVVPVWDRAWDVETPEPAPAPTEPLSASGCSCWGCGRPGVSFCPDVCLAPSRDLSVERLAAAARVRAENEARWAARTDEVAA